MLTLTTVFMLLCANFGGGSGSDTLFKLELTDEKASASIDTKKPLRIYAMSIESYNRLYNQVSLHEKFTIISLGKALSVGFAIKDTDLEVISGRMPIENKNFSHEEQILLPENDKLKENITRIVTAYLAVSKDEEK